MTWHLKDRELEKKLMEIAPDFVDSLNESLKLGEHEENSWTYRVWFGPYEDCYKFEMHVYDDELEEVPEYNPNGWNEYPAVKPPEGVLMRVEFIFDGILRRNCSTFEKGAWRITKSGDPSYDITLDNVKRFRPWED